MNRKVAEYYSPPVFDLYKNSQLQPKLQIIREMYIPDELQPNIASHEISADKTVKFLETL